MKNSQLKVLASQIGAISASPQALQARPALFHVILLSLDFVKNQLPHLYTAAWLSQRLVEKIYSISRRRAITYITALKYRVLRKSVINISVKQEASVTKIVYIS